MYRPVLLTVIHLESEIRKAYYPFIRDDIRLGAWVYPNGRQVLRMEQIDPETEEILRSDPARLHSYCSPRYFSG